MPDSAAPLLIGKSNAMATTRQVISVLAGSPSSVLISGESGTGKELVAQALHLQGPRRQNQFVPINCGGIPKDLLESELFGHRKGAFTGAVADRKGRFEIAHGGTLFLDEIGDLPLEMQVKLLRALQERRIEPLGAHRSIDVDVRIISATHKNLEEEVSAGRFREDLFYRLNVLPVQLAALRDRREDIHDLLIFFAKKHSPKGSRPLTFTPGLISALEGYSWPGNIRELSNLVDRFSTLFAGQELNLNDIPDWLLPKELRAQKSNGQSGKHGAGPALAPISPVNGHAINVNSPSSSEPDILQMVQEIRGDHNDYALDETAHDPGNGQAKNGFDMLHPNGISLKDRMTEIERSYIGQALERTQWNVSQTARLLGLQRTTLIEKLNKYGFRKEGDRYQD